MENERSGPYAKAASMMFMALLFAPLAAAWVGWNSDAKLTENRTLAPRPHRPRSLSELEALPAQIENYVNDRFPFRASLVQAHGKALVTLGESPTSDVVIGRDSWLYYRREGMEHLFGAPIVSAIQIHNFERMVRERAAWLAKRGCTYLFVIVPDKDTVYPEHLPLLLEMQYGKRLSQREQLLGALAPDVRKLCLDLSEPLKNAKTAGDLFHRTDTHWTTLGAWIGQNAIIERLRDQFPELTPLPLVAIDLNRSGGPGDMAGMIAQPELFPEPLMMGGPRIPRAITEAKKGIRRTHINDSSLLRAVVFGDSFSILLQPLLAERFSSAQFNINVRDKTMENEFQPELIEEIKPQVVITEVIERQLVLMHIHRNRPEVSGRGLAELFAESHETVLRVAAGSAPHLNQTNQLIVSESENALLMQSLGNDPYVNLPVCDVPAEREFVVRIEMTSPVETAAEFFFEIDSGLTSLGFNVPAGRSIHYLNLPPNTLAGKRRWRFDPGLVPGKFLLHSLEVRANKD